MKNRKLFIKIQSYLTKKSNQAFLLIFLLGLFLRIYKPGQLFLYGHDQDLAGWFIKDVLENRHLRLIGQETSTQGIFIGPLYYYLLIPFYFLFNMDPIGGVVLVTILGVFTIFSFGFVFSKIFGKKTRLVASLFYALSFYATFNDREVVPTMPVILWSVWFFYAINLLLKGKQRIAYTVLGILVGLIWHLNMALVLLIPLIPASQYLSKKKVDIKAIVFGSLGLFIVSLPLIIFELRHGFQQVRALYISLTTHQHDILSGAEKLRRVIYLASKNATGLLWGSQFGIPYEIAIVLLILLFIVLITRKIISKNQGIIMSLWLLLFLLFFSLYSKVLSEYYLNGIMVIWIALIALGTSVLIKNKREIALCVLVIFTAVNLYRFFSMDINKSGYIERRAVVAEIKKDAQEKDFPCVAVSYITKPGYELGYRYFFWLEDIHVNHPKSRSPVYTIVFPLREDIEVHKTFGAIGIIYPDYSLYTKEGIALSCSGENSNLTDPMFGYTE